MLPHVRLVPWLLGRAVDPNNPPPMMENTFSGESGGHRTKDLGTACFKTLGFSAEAKWGTKKSAP